MGPLGNGSYGEVHKYREDASGADVAIKLMDRYDIHDKETGRRLTEKEVEVVWVQREVRGANWLTLPSPSPP